MPRARLSYLTMIESIILENYRCWKDRHEIPLSRLTLFLGRNSAGKSSLFSGLGVLRQTLEGGTGYSIPMKCNGPYAQTGNFSSVVYRHQVERPISLGLSFTPPNPTKPFGVPSTRRRLMATFWHRTAVNDQGEEVSLGGHLARLKIELGDLSAPDTSAELVFEYSLEGWRLTNLPTTVRQFLAKSASDQLPPTGTDDPVSFILSEFTDTTVFRMRQGMPIMPGAGETSPKDSSEPEIMDEEGQGLVEQSFVKGSEKARVLVEDAWVRNMEMVRDELFRVLGAFRHIGPARKAPPRARVVDSAILDTSDVGHFGENTLPVLLGEPVLNKLESILGTEECPFPYTISAKRDSISGGYPGSVAWIDLYDKVNGVSVMLGDVGSGVSHAIPILVQLLASPDLTCAIEEPELHLNPSLQVWLMQFLVDSSIGARLEDGVQVLIETHSQVMLERLRRLVRTGRLAPQQNFLTIYIQSYRFGSRWLPMEMDKNADWTHKWPHGYFEEVWKELTEEFDSSPTNGQSGSRAS